MILHSIIFPAAGFVLALLIGYTFGTIQLSARLRNRKLQNNGAVTSGWAVMPGSMGRIAMLLLFLTFFQLVFPFLFENNGVQWLISAGVVLGYGWTLAQQLRRGSSYNI